MHTDEHGFNAKTQRRRDAQEDRRLAPLRLCALALKSTMKTQSDIQKAHDQLIAIILGEVPNPFPAGDTRFMQANCDVLCWLLGCEHNKTFANNLAKAEAHLAAQGFVLERLNN
jgi:hypothetical protein